MFDVDHLMTMLIIISTSSIHPAVYTVKKLSVYPRMDPGFIIPTTYGIQTYTEPVTLKYRKLATKYR